VEVRAEKRIESLHFISSPIIIGSIPSPTATYVAQKVGFFRSFLSVLIVVVMVVSYHHRHDGYLPRVMLCALVESHVATNYALVSEV
jgi:hypothetical protein